MSRKLVYAKTGGVVYPVNGDLRPLLLIPITTTLSAIPAVVVTASATPHTKGAYSELIASTPQAYNCLEISIYNTALNGSDSSALLDIAIGASGSEVVAVTNLAAGYALTVTTGSPVRTFLLPISVPSGSRIAARLQSAVASNAASVRIRPLSMPPVTIATMAIDTIGANTANSHGVGVTLPGTLNTKGAWTEITSSTPADYIALEIGVQGNGGITFSTGSVSVDIAVGASGSEVVVASDVILTTGTSESLAILSPVDPMFYVNIPAGSRISVRYSRSASNLSIDAIIYGIKEI